MKNTTKVAALAIVLMFGANIVKADGIIVADRSEKGCVNVQTEGIIVADRATSFFDKIIETFEGIIVADAPKGCDEKLTEGIIVADRAGILVSD